MEEVIESNGIFYKINKNKYESRELYLQRCWFIINNYKLKKFKFKELIYLSNLWINIKYNNVIYTDKIMLFIKDCIDQSDIQLFNKLLSDDSS